MAVSIKVNSSASTTHGHVEAAIELELRERTGRCGVTLDPLAVDDLVKSGCAQWTTKGKMGLGVVRLTEKGRELLPK